MLSLANCYFFTKKPTVDVIFFVEIVCMLLEYNLHIHKQYKLCSIYFYLFVRFCGQKSTYRFYVLKLDFKI
jgi:hypothetical protein